MLTTRNTLSATIRPQSAEALNRHLAAAIDLHAQVKQAHWNVRGPNFMAIHEWFDQVAGKVEGWIGDVVRRHNGPLLSIDVRLAARPANASPFGPH